MQQREPALYGKRLRQQSAARIEAAVLRILAVSSGSCGAAYRPVVSPTVRCPWVALVAEWIHFTLLGRILPTLRLKVYTFGGLMNSATKISNSIPWGSF